MVGQGYFNSGGAGNGGMMGSMMQGPMMGADPSMMMMFNQVSETLVSNLSYIVGILYMNNMICSLK
jgi:hypothetical protein